MQYAAKLIDMEREICSVKEKSEFNLSAIFVIKPMPLG